MLLPSRRLPLLGSASVPPTATWLCCAPPTGGRVPLLLFPTPTKKQKNKEPFDRGCVHAFFLIRKHRFLRSRPTRRLKDFERKVRKTDRKPDGCPAHYCILPLHLCFISPPSLRLRFYKTPGFFYPEISPVTDHLLQSRELPFFFSRGLNHIRSCWKSTG